MSFTACPTDSALEASLEAFEAAWRGGSRPPELADYVSTQGRGCAGPVHLAELIQLDLEYRWRRAPAVEARLVESYLARFPELNGTQTLLALAAEEYLVRHRFGDAPSHASFRDRFPQLAGLSQRLAQIDHLLQYEYGSSARCEPRSADRRADMAAYRYSDIVLEAMVGQGGIGKVYRARRKADGATVAVKILKKRFHKHPEYVHRFWEEARFLLELEHPHIVPIWGLGEMPGGAPFLIMPYVPGFDLQTLLERQRLPLSRVIGWGIQAAEAIHYAHEQGLIHCDLKPSNLLLHDDDHVFVADFGLACQMRGARRPLAVGGTLGFMAPEQMQPGLGAIGPWTDVYGLGSLLFALTAGRPPRAEEDWQHVVAPPGLRALCQRCRNPHPDQRPSSAQEVANRLREFAGLGRA